MRASRCTASPERVRGRWSAPRTRRVDSPSFARRWKGCRVGACCACSISPGRAKACFAAGARSSLVRPHLGERIEEPASPTRPSRPTCSPATGHAHARLGIRRRARGIAIPRHLHALASTDACVDGGLVNPVPVRPRARWCRVQIALNARCAPPGPRSARTRAPAARARRERRGARRQTRPDRDRLVRVAHPRRTDRGGRARRSAGFRHLPVPDSACSSSIARPSWSGWAGAARSRRCRTCAQHSRARSAAGGCALAAPRRCLAPDAEAGVN